MGAIFKGKPFRSGNSQAVRLPKAVAFPEGVELEIQRHGDMVTLRPAARNTIGELLEVLRALPRPATPWHVERIQFPRRPWEPEDTEDDIEPKA